MRSTALPLVALIALAAPLAPAAAVGGFRLPPAQTEPQQQPTDRQGPIAPDVPESRRPAPTPTPTPRAAQPAPEPTITPPRIQVPPPAAATTTPARRLPAPRADSPVATAAAPTAEPTLAAEPTQNSLEPAQDAAALPLPPAADPASQPGSDAPWWPWLVAVLALVGAGLAGWAWWRKRQGPGAITVPRLERPTLPPQPVPEAPVVSLGEMPVPAPTPAEPLHVSLEPLRLSLTLMNATLSYRLEVANRGLRPLVGLAIGADMISAHASMSREEQLAGPQMASGAGRAVQQIERLEPGESRVVEGEFRLPFGQIVPIRQGNAALLLPLARFRVEAEGAQPVVRTFVVGLPGNGSALQPFRLDQGPRVYPKLAQHAFA